MSASKRQPIVWSQEELDHREDIRQGHKTGHFDAARFGSEQIVGGGSIDPGHDEETESYRENQWDNVVDAYENSLEGD